MPVRPLGLAILTVLGFATAQDVKPPVAPVRNVVDEYYGVKVNDPYRYMENLDDPEVAGWFKAQAAYTARTLAAIPGRNAMLARLQELDRSTPAVVQRVRRFPGNRIYYEKRSAGENTFRLYVRDGFQGSERLLVNPDAFATKSGEHISLDWWEPSRDGRFLVFGVSASGSEQTVLHIVETASSKLLADTIDPCRVGQVSWSEDNQSFLYNRFQKLGPGVPLTDRYKNSHVYTHVIGRNADQDPVVLGPDVPGVTAVPVDWMPFTAFTPGSNYVLGVFIPGAESRRVIYKQPISAWGTAKQWQKLVDLADDVVGLAVHGEELYLISQRNASHRQVLLVKLSDPDLKSAKVLIPQGSSVIQDIAAASDALYVRTAEGGSGKVLRLEYGSGVAVPVPQPQSTSAWYFGADPNVAGFIVGIASWVKRDATYVFDPAAGAMLRTHLEPESPADIQGLEVTEVRVPSHDGTLIPLTIVARAGLPRDGQNPTILFGYGAYGMSIDPNFNVLTQPWFERGGIWAVAHVRGGGEYGEDWHAAGKGATKENTWRDFIACAEYLVGHKFTSPRRLGIYSGSAGSIMVGRAMEERPDLFAAVIDAVPVPDMIRFERTPNGPGFDAGHGVGSTERQRELETTDQYSFLLWQMKVSEFQPSRNMR